MATSPLLLRPVARTLTEDELRAVVGRYAADVRRGLHVPTVDAHQRWHRRIHRDTDVDVWLIGWAQEQGTELHDHGGSSGAFTVVTGELTEYVWEGGRTGSGALVPRRRREADSVSFGPRYVHDVRNHVAEPAVSVHAYSPPITLMNYYDAREDGLLRWASRWTDDPETPGPVRAAS